MFPDVAGDLLEEQAIKNRATAPKSNPNELQWLHSCRNCLPQPRAEAKAEAPRLMSYPLLHDTSVPEQYPMHLMAVTTFLDLAKLQPHQELKAQGLLTVRTAEHEGRILFISHQWLAWDHPDPDSIQVGALQGLLHRLIAGSAGEVETDWVTQLVLGDMTRLTAAELMTALPHAFIWMDYISMPQGSVRGTVCPINGLAAINSIPAYAEHATLILVLVPPTFHANATEASGTRVVCNYQSWCRSFSAYGVLVIDAWPRV